ncbi:hypothetical protein PGT21_017383 [Puccinia graminis f. sp. tritici]|uniref:Uncharacterized protein n=2 Tax=Puccinia graminis f. sp. tritici TaxID=56615 RepID=E3K1C2_PUCGT|nr:uncharacterized protein PGTG_04053 [Puccinia graminis f. sp. tritici CRL 75-36-700-3]EFP78097.1 hypothetical protein PGTG_04053 [Puccinia graminis f. sp. tritici CRL 75-36-700-3]KAA1112978.1 hypothetical protein PGT21_017383 [Puccinia graminis f. sp. tritici]
MTPTASIDSNNKGCLAQFCTVGSVAVRFELQIVHTILAVSIPPREGSSEFQAL